MTETLKQEKNSITQDKSDVLLEVEGLKKYFPVKAGLLQKTVGHIKAVDDVSFAIKKGETFGLVGESGCGKSTTGRTLIRLYEPTDGKILFEGKDISGLNEKQLKPYRKDIQMVFQDPYSSLNPRKTVGTILEEPFRVHKLYSKAERKERVEHLLEKVGLNPDLRNRYPHEFSGGQRQRIGIARALTLNPKLIIGDEPVSALDVSIQSQVLNIMDDLQKDFGLTYLFIAHDLGVVKHISDRIGVMYLGRMMEVAPKRELYSNPLHPYTQALLSAVPKSHPSEVKKERIILKGDVPSPSNPPTGCVFHTRCPKAMDHCKVEVPKLQELEPGHFVACHLYN
ncbi:peptide/nickel transport system ATP-binding protein/oligopeptide transport system ATP-binding protein [Evansella vedderi]|uniref:Peptide/nickel transport system ATP-binding protein/oligopeptide transport system ATP-binding protein n=1 Tax=Evansella vedderi TaxID=38282 RepID=A0ABU0A2T5_9BACI|nr:dipeptide ABC transporter ATP-binding protein [Evansella vedderi]MDQ0257804.1 peptide/nickel transport system ATP-binding protein/oligopeptide transport system ATP-binding protein [Evansella vedderi]